MPKSSLICVVVVFCFSAIQFIEISSFLARYSGILIGKKTLAYALQNAVFMLTRFFTMALLPLLGLLIDIGVDKKHYLWMVSAAFAFSGVFGIVAIFFSQNIVNGFVKVLQQVELGRGLLLSLLKLPIYILRKDKVGLITSKPSLQYLLNSRIFWMSSLVFAIYALSVFMVFLVSLSFPEYRASISQLSGVTNALATVLLTFIIEPKISLAIDKDDDEALDMIFSLIIGRIFGVTVLSQLLVIVLGVGL